MRRSTWKAVLLVAVAAVTGATAASAQDEEKKELVVGKWYPNLETGITLTQSSYSNNWAGGDKGSIVWTWILNGSLENQLSPKVNTYNTLKLAFGQTHQQKIKEDRTREWDRPEKSTDLIDFESIWRFTLGLWVDPFLSGRFESQFQDASDSYGRTLSFNPLKFKETAGVAHEFYNEEDRSLLTRFGFSFRQSSRKLFTSLPPGDEIVRDAAADGGVEWTTDYKNKVLDDRVTWTSRLSFYQPVFYSGKDELEALGADSLAAYGLDDDVESYATTMDIEFENIFSTQITKIISVNLYTKLVYDKYDNTIAPEPNDAGDGLTNPSDVKSAIRKAGQFKQTLSIGVTYRFL